MKELEERCVSHAYILNKRGFGKWQYALERGKIEIMLLCVDAFPVC